MTPDTLSERELIDFVVLEARLLDEKRYDEWNALFAEDAYYWVPLTPGQPDGINYTSHVYADKLLRDLRIKRLSHPRAYAQQPPSRSQHLLQNPSVDKMDAAANEFLVRTPFHYTEAQNDEVQFLVGTAWHHLKVVDGALKLTLKRVDLINSDAALTAFQLFV